MHGLGSLQRPCVLVLWEMLSFGSKVSFPSAAAQMSDEGLHVEAPCSQCVPSAGSWSFAASSSALTMSGATSSTSSTTRSTDTACRDLPPREGGEPDLHPAAVLVVCLDGFRFVEGEADEVVEADAGEPSQICHGGFDAGLAREQVDVPRGTRVDGSGKHALTALQDKGRIRVAEDAAQQPVEVEAGDGAVGVSSGDFLAASLTAISSAAGVLCLMIGLSGRMRRGLLREARAGPLAVCFRRARRAGCQASRSR